MYKNFNEFGFAIIEQAIMDYKFLKRLGVQSAVVDNRDVISRNEIMRFFHSQWCDTLLSNMRITGEDILNYLNRE